MVTQHTGTSPPFPPLHVRQSASKGLGTFASVDIPAFIQIVSDPALIAIKQGEDLPQIFEQFEALSPENQILYLQLHKDDKAERENAQAKKLSQRGFSSAQIPKMVQVASVFQANGFNVQDAGDKDSPDIKKRAVFPSISRLNHSCMPNAHTYFNPHSRAMEVRTISDIPKDAEVEIAYFNPLLPLSKRKERMDAWQFECGCPACVGPAEQQTLHEQRRQRAVEYEGHYLSNMLNPTIPAEQLVAEIYDLVKMVEEDQSLAGQLPNAYEYLAMARMATLANNPNPTPDPILFQSIIEHLRKATDAEARITGEQSPPTLSRRQKLEMVAPQDPPA